MAQQTINIGAAANDGTGDPIRSAFTKVNSNFTELYEHDANNTLPGQTGNSGKYLTTNGTSASWATLTYTAVSAPITSLGQVDDKVGMYAFDATYAYYCTANYDGITNIWKRVGWSGDTW